MKKIEDYLSVEQVAQKMGFTERTIKKWCNNKDIPYYKVGRQIRIYEQDIIKFIESGRAY